MTERKGGDRYDPVFSAGYARGYAQAVEQAANIAALSDSPQHAAVSIRELDPNPTEPPMIPPGEDLNNKPYIEGYNAGYRQAATIYLAQKREHEAT